MGAKTFAIGEAFGIKMEGATSLDEMALVDAAARAAYARVGRGLIVFTLAHDDSEKPDPKVREAMRRSIDRMFDQRVFRHVYVVLRGEDLATRISRTMFNAMLVLTRYRRSMTMCGSLAQAVRRAERDLALVGVSEDALMRGLG